MRKTTYTVTNNYLAPVQGIQVTVNQSGGSLAQLYSDNGVTALANPMTSDAGGAVSFYVGNGIYDIVTPASRDLAAKTTTVAIFDPVDTRGVEAIILAKSAAGFTAPADTNENTLATIPVPANALGPNGVLRFTLRWTTTSNTNVKTSRVRFSGASGTDFLGLNQASQSAMMNIGTISNRGVTNSQQGNFLNSGALSNPTLSFVTAAVDTTVATSIVISAQKATGTDTFTLESYLVELIQG